MPLAKIHVLEGRYDETHLKIWQAPKIEQPRPWVVSVFLPYSK